MIDIQEIKTKLIDKLRDSGWAAVLKGFIMSSDFDKVLKALEDQIDNGKRFTPQLKNVFTAFEECKFEDLKVVIVGQDPYPQLGVADGMAFSCSITNKAQPSLNYIWEAINRTVYEPIPEPIKTDLRPWANQGVLLLNSALTTEVGKPGTHQKIWQAFIAYTLDTISASKKDIVFAFMGKTAQELGDLVYDKFDRPETGHYKINTSHPASAAYNKLEQWDCNDVFNEINRKLEAHGKEKIKW